MPSWVKVILILLAGLLIRAPLAKTVYWRTPDAVEYLNVGRNIVDGLGLTQSIKYTFFTDNPVVTSALFGRPLGTSFLVALLWKINPDGYFVQSAWLFLGAIIPVVFFLITGSVTGSLLIALNPNLLVTNRLILSEIPFLLFTLVFIYVLRKSRYALAGIFWGLAFLTRWEGIFLGFLLWPRFKLTTILSFLIISGPYFIANFLVTGSPVSSYNYNHFRVFAFQQAMSQGFGQTFPTPAEFVSGNFFWVLKQIAANIFSALKAIAGYSYFGVLVLFLFNQKILNKIFFVSIILCSLYVVLWSAIFEWNRHLLTAYSLLLLAIFLNLKNIKFKKLFYAACLFTMAVYLVSDIRRIAYMRDGDLRVDTRTEKAQPNLYSWVKNNTNKDDVLAYADPWLLNLYTNRPTILLPYNLTGPQMAIGFSKKFKVKYLLVFGSELPDLSSADITLVQTFDGTRIYKVSY